MIRNIISLTFIALTCMKTIVYGFSISQRQPSNRKYFVASRKTELRGLIEADIETDSFDDPGQASIQQTKECVSILRGKVQTNKNEINPVAEDLKLYTKLIPLSNQDEVEGKVLCKGMGTEVYTDPGSSAEKIIIIAPENAVRSALSGIETSPDIGKLCITFTGGDDLMVHEVLQGVEMMTSGLNLGNGKSIEFRSLCHESFPVEKCGVAAVNVEEGYDGAAFWHSDQWWTVSEDDGTAII